MIKIKPTTQEYEAQLAEAAIILGAYMQYFPMAECREQQDVVDAANECIKNIEQMLK